MKTGKDGIELIKESESLRLYSYLCPSNILTIGYGHTKGVKIGDVITKEEAEILLKEDLEEREDFVNNLRLPLNQFQFDALISFVYNVGSGNFIASTLYRVIRKNINDAEIITQFMRWNKSTDMKVLPGLIIRRCREAELFFRKYNR